ncbi:MAG: nitrilase-related carbon-nitrogen hydrolase, partial [Anaerolineae bacterium]
DEPYRIYNYGGAKIGVIICFDWLFPEAIRSLALQGADIICHPSNLDPTYRPQWMVVRCIENRVFVLTANRTGWEEREGRKRMTFQGRSQILSPKGRVLGECGPYDEGVQVVDIDIKEARRKYVNRWNDVLNDRQPHCYTL